MPNDHDYRKHTLYTYASNPDASQINGNENKKRKREETGQQLHRHVFYRHGLQEPEDVNILFLENPPEEQFTECWLLPDQWTISSKWLRDVRSEDFANKDGEERTRWSKFKKSDHLKLPESCIESAEYAIQVEKLNRTTGWGNQHNADFAKKPENHVKILFSHREGNKIFDLAEDDIVEAVEETSRCHQHANALNPQVGQGWALVCREGSEREDDEWTVHCVAIVARNNVDRGVIVVEEFAVDPPARSKKKYKVKIKSDWKFRYYKGLEDFKETYAPEMPRDKYVLGLLHT